jgi:anti-anti-sigma factor
MTSVRPGNVHVNAQSAGFVPGDRVDVTATAMTDSSWSSRRDSPCRAQVSEVGDAMALRIVGEFDMAAAAEVSEVLSTVMSPTLGRVEVDLSDVTFMDAAGLQMLVTIDNRLAGDGRPGLAVRGASGIVRRIFELTRTTSLLDDREPTVVTSGVLPAASRQARSLDVARREAGLSVTDLFVAYFALGGTADYGQLVAHLGGDTHALNTHEQDVAIHALNERLIDCGRRDRLLSYTSEGPQASRDR